MNVTKTERKESTKHCCGSGCRRRDSAEHEEEGGALIGQRITENNVTNADRDVNRRLERIVSPENLNNAYKRVVRNKGAGGVDGMKVDELLQYLKDNGKEIRESVLAGKYKPAPVRRVEIPKDNGKKRMPGIPTAVDRVIQQAIAQVLIPIYEPEFVETSYGFRPGKSAHDAIRKCQEYLNEGYVWAVDMDLEKFFDTVNQSKLMEILSKKIKDGRVISLIHKYLQAGAVHCGRFEDTTIGVPQGGPLYQPRVHGKSKEKMKAKVKRLTGRRYVPDYQGWKQELKQFITGWVNYYKLANMGNWLKQIDEWMRRRIRMVFWKRWKRVKTRYHNLEKLGISHSNAGILANSRKGCWRIAGSPILNTALSNERLEKDGFQYFFSYYKSVTA